jgi:hypothetical protein
VHEVKIEGMSEVVRWVFDDSTERRAYLVTRRSLAFESVAPLAVLILAIAFASYSFYVGVSPVTAIGTLSLPVGAIVVMLIRRTRSLTAVEVLFKKDQIVLQERFLHWNGERIHQLATIRSKLTTSAHWGSDGLVLMGRFLLPFSVVLSYRILGDEGIEVAEEWCRRNGIVIEGVKPLPGSYERPVAHPRGL